MSLNILKKELKSDRLRNAYLFYGDEQYLKEYYLKQLVLTAVGEKNDFNFIKLAGKDIDLDELVLSIESYPLTGEKKIVLIDDLLLDDKDTDIDALKQIFSDIPEHTVLIVYQDTVEMDQKKASVSDFLNFFSKTGLLVNFAKADENELVSWVIRQVKSKNKIIDSSLARLLTDLCGSDMTTLKNEIEKLTSYSVTETITKNQIDAVVTKTLDVKVFDLTDALFKPDYKKAFEVLQELFSLGTEPSIIAGTIFGALIRLYKVKTALNSGLSKAAAAKLLNMKEFAVEINIRQCRCVSAERLRRMILSCEKADRALKSAKTEKSIVLERLIGEILVLEKAD